MSNKRILLKIPMFLVLFFPLLYSQQDTASKNELKEVKSFLETLKKIKISGYIQSQFQIADQNGIHSFAGGDFPANAKSRFNVRRGRIKFNYNNELTQYVLQIDATEKGVAIKDAYAQIREPWLKTFALTAGIFNRPFGFEIAYSSGSRESPERSRLFQTLFPGERDLGVQLDINPEKNAGLLHYFNLAAGLFAGNGPNPETDNGKDFIGRLGFKLPFNENFSVDGGVSGYLGTIRKDDNNKTFTYNGNSSTTVDSLSSYIKRDYAGADLQINLHTPYLGKMALRGEYIQGKNPGSFLTNTPYKVGSGDVYLRNVYGYYLMYIQNIGENNQFVLKYDVFDPNSDVSPGEVNTISTLSPADIKFSTLGLGWIYHWNNNVKFTLYYDMVSNEKVNKNLANTSLSSFTSDQKDNVFTLRMQVKF